MPRGGWNKGKTKSEGAGRKLIEALEKGELTKRQAVEITGISGNAFESLLATMSATTLIYEGMRDGKTVYGLLKV